MNKENISKRVNPKILPAVIVLVSFLIIIALIVFLISLFQAGKRRSLNIARPTPVPIGKPSGQTLPTPVIETPQNLLQNHLGTVSFQIPSSNFPQKVSLFRFTPGHIGKPLADRIAISLAFNNTPKTLNTKDGPVLYWQNGSKTLIIYLDAGNIQYYSPQGIGGRSVTSSRAISQIAQNFLSKFSPLSNNLVADEKNISYFLATSEMAPASSFSTTDIYNVPFIEQVDSIPVYSQFGNSAQGNVFVDKSGGIQKFFLNTPIVLSTIRSVGIMNVDEVKNRILQGYGTIVSYGDYQTSLPVPDTTTFTSLDLGYLRDNTNKILYPIFILKGTARVGKQGVPIVVYLPAY